jgi:hypothetical protein
MTHQPRGSWRGGWLFAVAILFFVLATAESCRQ